MGDAFDRIDRLFESELDVDSSGSLAALADSLAAIRPRLLVVADHRGEVRAAWWRESDSPPDGVPTRTAVRAIVGDASRSATRCEFARDETLGERRFTVAERPGESDTEYLLGWTEGDPESEIELVLGSRIAIRCVRTGGRILELESRIRHLVNEHEILSHSRLQVVSDMLEAKEDQARQQREYVDRLESEVLARSTDLREALARAEAANEAKSAFLANVSHEFRTPMTAILGFVELIRDAVGDSEEVEESLRTIEENGQHLLRILGSILDIAAIGTEAAAPAADEFDPRALIEEVVAGFRPVAEKQRDRLTLAFGSDVPALIRSDSERLRRVLSSLLDNAIKFTEGGKVAVRVERRDEKGETRLVLEIADTGIGMVPEQLESLFEPFVQKDGSSTRRFGGAGLGLACAKELVRTLEGEIVAHSELGRGSSLTVVLPVAVVERPVEKRPISSEFAAESDLTKVIQEFVGELPRRIEEIERVLTAGDLAGLARVAAPIRDEAQAVGFPQVAAEIAELEAAGRTGSSESTGARLENLRGLVSRLTAPA